MDLAEAWRVPFPFHAPAASHAVDDDVGPREPAPVAAGALLGERGEADYSQRPQLLPEGEWLYDDGFH